MIDEGRPNNDKLDSRQEGQNPLFLRAICTSQSLCIP